MTAVVIGGQGFLGASIVRALAARNIPVTVVDKEPSVARSRDLFDGLTVEIQKGDIMDLDRMVEVTKGAKSVYHLAGKLGTSELDDDIRSAVDANVVGALNVYKASLQNSVGTVFNASKPNVWLNTYSITKFAAEQFLDLYNTFGATRYCALRYFNAYGPFQAAAPIRKIIPAFAQLAARSQPIEVYGSGEQVVDMIYSDDIGRITVEFVEATPFRGTMDLGRGVGLTVNQIARAVNKHFGNEAGVVNLPMRRGETPETKLIADIEPLRRELGELSFADWDTSLASTLDWYAERLASVHAA